MKEGIGAPYTRKSTIQEFREVYSSMPQHSVQYMHVLWGILAPLAWIHTILIPLIGKVTKRVTRSIHTCSSPIKGYLDARRMDK